ncbi:SpoIID/LytB domain-containing protein [Candidatus Omnitrophota bacterium]
MKSLIILLALLVFNQPAELCHASEQSFVRVAVAREASQLNLQVKGTYQITEKRDGRILTRGRDLRTTLVACEGGILMGERSFSLEKLFIDAKSSESITINGRRFRGDMQIIKDGFTLTAVNYIDFEDYIKGVLYHEASHYWPQEALRAQAVAARTFAYDQTRQNSSRAFDVTNDIYSQVYGGRVSERYRTNKAVEATRGEILTYNGRAFPTYYHATCAGHTEDASLLWNIDIPPLEGVACPYCKESPHYSWQRVLSLKEIAEKLSAGGYEIKDIEEIIPLEKDASGRIKLIKIGSSDADLTIAAKHFRRILNPNIIRSTNFSVEIAESDAVFSGFGWGHGAGMCQWGAYFMSKEGKDYEEILDHYYPGAELETIGF